MSKRYRVKKINEEPMRVEPFPVGKEVRHILYPGHRWTVHFIGEGDPHYRYLLQSTEDHDDRIWARPGEVRL